jgi:hypothetical protein
MFPQVDTKDPTVVEVEVQAAYLAMFPRGDRLFVPKVFGWVIDCFTGNYDGYLPIDARYHDFEHTLQVTLCLTRLLRQRHAAKATPEMTQRMFELTIIAILMHDTGYLKLRDDTQGTGAKYTLIHVARSADFARRLLREKNFSEAEIDAVRNMIRCTGVNADLSAIPFQAEWEKVLGFALASADLLGQMAADDYVDKLPILFEEFAESARHQTGDPKATGMFKSAEDLIRKTPLFWEKYVVSKITNDFLGVYRYLSQPYPEGPNWYVQRIEQNIARVHKQVAAMAPA